MPTYIIEHLEPKVWDWCIIEYKHISHMVGKENLLITNVKQNNTLNAIATTKNESVTTLNLKNACVLDPDAKTTLTPEEAKQFDFFIFGGILGDDPPQKRTFPELTSKLPKATARNLGPHQMSTDTAVYVTLQIVKGKKLSDIKFQDSIEIKLAKNESTILPYQYVLINGKPMISEELVNYIKERKGF
jgi:ribosome biogenesis SPOUT family RNA methylase Rps3